MTNKIAILALLGIGFLMLTSNSRAEFTECNQTLDVVNQAVGQEVDDTWQSEGWWTIGANRCVDVIREELSSRFIYIYATDVFGQPVLEGETDMCIGSKRFFIREKEMCWQRGHKSARFHEVDTQENIRWTLFIRQGRSE